MNFSKLKLRVLIALLAGVLIFGFLNWKIVQKERVIEQGRVALLQLAPLDPRSLMQGDYMALRFALANEVRDTVHNNQMLVLEIGENNVAHFKRVDDGRTALQAGEIRFRYALPNGFFFEEGQGQAYQSARYGEFRVTDDGHATLTQLRDAAFNALKRGTAR